MWEDSTSTSATWYKLYYNVLVSLGNHITKLHFNDIAFTFVMYKKKGLHDFVYSCHSSTIDCKKEHNAISLSGHVFWDQFWKMRSG